MHQGFVLNMRKYNERSLTCNSVDFSFKVRGVMTDNQKSKLIVWVNADGFDPNGDYDLYTECGYHPVS